MRETLIISNMRFPNVHGSIHTHAAVRITYNQHYSFQRYVVICRLAKSAMLQYTQNLETFPSILSATAEVHVRFLIILNQVGLHANLTTVWVNFYNKIQHAVYIYYTNMTNMHTFLQFLNIT